MKLESSLRISEKYSNINLFKIRPMWLEFYHADRRPDRQKW
jgi:hypothetical protein